MEAEFLSEKDLSTISDGLEKAKIEESWKKETPLFFLETRTMVNGCWALFYWTKTTTPQDIKEALREKTQKQYWEGGVPFKNGRSYFHQ
jgi:hypothetical protein